MMHLSNCVGRQTALTDTKTELWGQLANGLRVEDLCKCCRSPILLPGTLRLESDIGIVRDACRVDCDVSDPGCSTRDLQTDAPDRFDGKLPIRSGVTGV